MLSEIPIGLAGNGTVAEPVGLFLQIPLKCDPGKGMLRGEVLLPDVDDQGCVGIFAVPFLVAHAVDTEPSLFRRGIDHISSGTHAEAVDAAAILCFMGKLVGGGPQDGLLFRKPVPAVKGFVDQTLGVLDPKAHGKGLLLHGNGVSVKHGDGIPGAVSDGKDTAGGGNAELSFLYLLSEEGFVFFPETMVFWSIQQKSGKDSLPDHKIGKAGFKEEFPSQGADPFSEALHHGDQDISADMGLLFVQDVFAGPHVRKGPEDIADIAFLSLYGGVELSVGKGTGASLSELHVAFRIQAACLKKLLRAPDPFFHGFSPLDDQGMQTGKGQGMSSKKPAGTASDHNGPSKAAFIGRCLLLLQGGDLNRDLFLHGDVFISELSYKLFFSPAVGSGKAV